MRWKADVASLLLFGLLTGNAPASREVYLMGTRSVLTAWANTETAGEAQLERHIRILEETEAELSVWRADTPLSRLNAHSVGARFEVSPRLFELFERIQFWWKETGGAFDPGVGKLLHARGFYGRPPATTSKPVVSGFQHFRLDPQTRQILKTADVWIDSGAFGKGEALDRVRHESLRLDASPWLIDLGGQVMVHGLPPGRAFWAIDIAHPQHRQTTAITLRLTSGSIATSSGSEQPGHILDPVTGNPVAFSGSVVVWNESALVADILSTALFVMGPERGLRWAESRAVAACFLVPKPNGLGVFSTPAFTARFKI